MDIVQGIVIKVLDGDTFDLDIDRVGTANKYTYNDVERIRLAAVNAPELTAPGGKAALARLRTKIQSKRVQVSVHARDRYRRLVGDVKLIA